MTAGRSDGGFGWICCNRLLTDFGAGSRDGYIVIFDVDLAVCQTGTVSRGVSYSSSIFSCLISVSGGKSNGTSFATPFFSV